MNEFPAWLTSTLASDATEGRGVLPPWIGSLKPGARAVGPAFVALMSQDDNLSVREAIKASPLPGSVLVGKVVLPAVAPAEKLFAAALEEITLNDLLRRTDGVRELAASNG